VDIAVYYSEIHPAVVRQLTYDFVDELSLLKPLPYVTPSGIQGKHRVMFDIQNDCSVLVDNGSKMWGGSLHGSHLNALDNWWGSKK
jgi:hypothetical protein